MYPRASTDNCKMDAIVSYFIQRIFFPILFTLCIISRPAILAVPYLIFLFSTPFLSLATKSTGRGHRCFLFIVFIVTVINVSLQICLQATLIMKGFQSINSLDKWERFFRAIGISEPYNLDSQSICWGFLMDVILCATSAIAIIAIGKVSVHENDIEDPILPQKFQRRYDNLLSNNCSFLERTAILCVISTWLLAAIQQPSFFSAIYFVAYVFLSTSWAMNKKLYKTFIGITYFLSFVLVVHISGIFVYQAILRENNVDGNSSTFRYIGIQSLSKPNLTEDEDGFVKTIRILQSEDFSNLIVLSLCYYTSMIFLRDIRRKKKTDVISAGADNFKSVDDILNVIADEVEFIQILNVQKRFLKRIYQFVCRHSNIVSNLMLMIWGITFRNVSSILFLLIVTVLWMRSFDRKSAHGINLFIVLYADIHLIIQYFYCLIHDVNEDAHHRELESLNFHLIGVVGFSSLPCIPLLFKALCTLTFCFTLRQEKRRLIDDNRQSTPTTSSTPADKVKSSNAWAFLYSGITFLTHIWVAMIIITMFTYSIIGSEMNLMKLIYMIFVLVFVTSYQLSLTFWRNIMYTLWMLVLITSMCNLILIYTYEFDGLHIVWQDYLGVDQNMQAIIGLQRYGTKRLLVQLVFFTFLVVITAIQMLIFHKKYSNQFLWNSYQSKSEKVHSASTFNHHFNSNRKASDPNANFDGNQGVRFINGSKEFFALICSFLELQFFKVILILGFLMSISEISVLNFIIIILVVIGCFCEDTIPNLCCALISFAAGLIIIFRMLHRSLKISEELLSLLCTVEKNNTEQLPIEFCDLNQTFEWLGIYKSSNEQSLIQYLGHYLIFIVAATIFSAISYYQTQKRITNGDHPKRPDVLFIEVTREDADKKIHLLIKYLFNYGFFKFGIEITLVTLTILICKRRDSMSVVYIIWLCVLLSARRRTKKILWPFFVCFILLSIIAQYIIMLNVPSFLSSKFEWLFIQHAQQLIGLKDNPKKLILDFLVLICACRQRIVFKIEKKIGGKKYPGGRNESSVKDINIIISGQLPIRTHDFLYPTNWLDILKCIMYFSSFWITLSIVLLAGIKNGNIFSFGYLIPSFVFCYIGTYFYMKPIHSILGWWNHLIAYNIFVLLVKAILNLRFFIDNAYMSHHLIVSAHSFLSNDKQTAIPLDLTYDGICFAFLIFQLRIFKTIDFCHIINDSKAIFVCDSRGTKLLADRVQKMNSLQEQRELEMLEKIKINVERIKANQRKFEPDIIAAKSHNEAVRYNGKYLYEEVVENAENNQTRNESTEDEESVVLRNQPQPKEMRKDEADIIEACQSTVSIQSIAQDDEENIPNNYLIPMLRDFIISLTLYLYKFSRNYRFVHEFLSQDKKLLKLKACHGASSEESGEERIYFFSHQHSVVSELIQSIWFALIANTDVICYLLIFLNIIFTMSIAMLPLSMCVCFWAALTIPRPSKRFWLTVIVFIEITVFLQYMGKNA